MKPERMGRKENKETNTHTPMPGPAQEKKKKQEQRKEKQCCPKSERLNQPHSRSPIQYHPRTGWLSQLDINTRNIDCLSIKYSFTYEDAV